MSIVLEAGMCANLKFKLRGMHMLKVRIHSKHVVSRLSTVVFWFEKLFYVDVIVMYEQNHLGTHLLRECSFFTGCTHNFQEHWRLRMPTHFEA